MKLFTRYSRINLLATILLFLISSLAYYSILQYVLLTQIDKDLRIERREILVYVGKHGRLPDSLSVADQLIRYSEAKDSFNHYFSTAYLDDPEEREHEKFRQFFFSIQINRHWYKVEVDKSLEKTNNIIHSILLVTLAMILLILAVSLVINRVVLKRIWRPFYHSLETVKGFQVSKGEPLKLAPTPINEFQFMNGILEKITGQARSEYVALKTFSENASHELQTPIAIIRSKLDLLIQEEGLSERQSQGLQAAYDSVHRLTKLTQSLLMLAKIENQQFPQKEEVDFSRLLQKKIEEFNELWVSQHINVQHKLEPFRCLINPELAELLVNNLLSNATRHNHSGGAIWIECREDGLRITNTSLDEPIDETQLYSRFHRPNPQKEGNGLGLSIIRLICETSGLTIRYETVNGTHSFIITKD